MKTNQLDAGRFSVLINESGLPSPSLKVKTPAFTMIQDGEMPTPGDIKWSPEKLERLMQWPKYKPARDKTQILPPHLRSNSPMTMEDKANAKAILTDKVLRGSLRVPDHGLEEFL